MTPGSERLEVISERVSEVPRTRLTRRMMIFDHDNLTATIPTPTDPGHGGLADQGEDPVHSFLYQLMQWSFKLFRRHRTLLEELPVPQPNRESVLPAREAALAPFVAEAPAIAAASNVEPADTVRRHLDRRGVGVPLDAGSPAS